MHTIRIGFMRPPIESIKMKPLFSISPLSLFLLLFLAIMPNAQTHLQQVGVMQPTFVKDMNGFEVKENTPVGEVIYTLEAQLEPSNNQQVFNILYGIEDTKLFSVDKNKGQVRVAQPLDREQTSDSVTFQVIATAVFGNQRFPTSGSPTKLTITVWILDENDNPPRVERVVVGRNEYDFVSLARQQPILFGQPNTNLINNNFIINGNNKIPIVRITASENTTIGSTIVDLIETIDVDKASSTPLKAICLDCEPEFELRSLDENLLNDRLNSSIVLINPLIHIPRNNIRQLNVIYSDEKFNSSIIFEITIEDIQNRPPQFIGSTTCIVHENIPIDKVILTIHAIDGDVMNTDDATLILPKNPYQNAGRHMLYDIIKSDEFKEVNENFKLHPLTGQLQVANRLDREAYLNLNDVLSIKVRARELTTNPNQIIKMDDSYDFILEKLEPFTDKSLEATSEVDITVILIDENDNEPHWLNASEISVLNMNQSPNWYTSLPKDKDTGRLYQLEVKENSLAGTPITTHNEMFVYDLDNGKNSNFNITLIDQFKLFDVEPKQVSGFASVTLKLLKNNGDKFQPQSQPIKMLDYENPNERSFIVQLIATETNTRERLSSKAQILIKVIDVNDNAPEFKESTYHANIREDAPPGKTVLLVQANDKDEISNQRLTYSLHGHSAYLFDINRSSGMITVAKCDQTTIRHADADSNHSPIVKHCIDYEIQRKHHLMVEVSDGELSSKVPLTVFIDDASDNPPVFTLPVVDVVIEEGVDRLDPPIKIEAVDADQSSVLSYSIIEGNFENLFAINNATGELQLTRAIRIPHEDFGSSINGDYRQQQLNKMTLIVQATDGTHTTNGTIRVDVLDANDNVPKFMRPKYATEIPESISPGEPINLTVRAIDSDRGNNAKISYAILRGSYNQFEIDEFTGALSVSKYAQNFDTNKRENYTLEVVAHDHGLASKSSSVFVYIRIVDIIREPPEFEPQIQRTTVIETALNNTLIHRMALKNQDRSGGALIFEPGPIEALDKNGQPVPSSEINRLELMFMISTNSGEVMVSSSLDHDFASYINMTIYVSSPRSPMSEDMPIEEYNPRSVGYLIINVVDNNNNPPIFAAPWMPQQPELSYQMLEELPVGSILTQLIANDIDSKISHFKIDPPNDYFELLSPQLGIIVNKKLIDYDALMSQTFLAPGLHHRSSIISSSSSNNNNISSPLMMGTNVGNNIIQFNVYVFDSGLPQLSAKATISVEILPVNDWDCRFEQSIYEVQIKENTPADTLVVQVRANDLDYGEPHNTLKYQLVGEFSELFDINPKTGVITVSNKGSINLDREKFNQSKFTITVIARDDPQIQALSGTQYQPLRQSRVPQQHPRTCSSTIKVNVDDINDNPPLFTQKRYEVVAYDTDIVAVPLIKLMIQDDDSPNSSNASKSTNNNNNSFKIISGNINDLFNISNSGVIYITKPIDESTLKATNGNSIQLRVQVKQQSASVVPLSSGQFNSFTDECIVHVNFVKINRYGPEWRFDALNEPILIKESTRPGTLVTQLKCIDKDYEMAQINRFGGIGESEPHIRTRNDKRLINTISPIRYYIKDGGLNVSETAEFKLDTVTGNLITKIELDREEKEYYQLIVACEDNGKPQSLESITPIFISVLDVDDNKPEFLVSRANQKTAIARHPSTGKSDLNQKLTIEFTVEEHQSKGLPVGELKAIDRDLESSNPITYCLIEGNEFLEFSLDRITGILYTNQTLDREKQSSYDLLVKAINDGSTCEEHIISNFPQNNSLSVTTDRSKLRVKRSNDYEMPSLSGKQKEKLISDELSYLSVKVEVLDINDNAPIFKRPIYRAGIHHRSLMNTLITQVAAFDPDFGLNGTLNYKITEILLYKTVLPQSQAPSRAKYDVTNEQPIVSKPIKLIQFPFRIDQQGNLYTQQLLTQYQLMSMFVLNIEATEQAEPWRTAKTKLEIYIYETSSQLKIRVNLHPRLVELYRTDIEKLLSNATKYIAIINRAKSYHDAFDSSSSQSALLRKSSSNQNYKLDDTNSQVPPAKTNTGDHEPNYSNIHLIFVDHFRIVNPNLVMEKFDLTSAQLFTPQSVTQTEEANLSIIGKNQLVDNQQAQQQTSKSGHYLQFNEVSSLIDKIALASAVQSAEFHSNPSSLAGVDWLESPSMLYVTFSAVLMVLGFIAFLFGCCCTSRIKDHIVKVAMDKLVKQQNLQAKINEQVLAAANKASNGRSTSLSGPSGHDYILQQGGFMSSFDATKGCITNNNENMNIVQRAMESGEYIDPNYTTLNGHVNTGAHYYDDTELEQQQTTHGEVGHREFAVGTSKEFLDGSPVSMLVDEIDDNDGDKDLNNAGKQQHLIKKGKVVSNGDATNNIQHQHQHHRQRQQIPNNSIR